MASGANCGHFMMLIIVVNMNVLCRGHPAGGIVFPNDDVSRYRPKMEVENGLRTKSTQQRGSGIIIFREEMLAGAPLKPNMTPSLKVHPNDNAVNVTKQSTSPSGTIDPDEFEDDDETFDHKHTASKR
ncbi:uncharacterized protein LOC106089810 isoform X3 [Stomoxys calcitrans]|uniref:uncharacterized protein LOC106089810 isoform X3 n=1 Tax=Stomoxys calcitrans TaxID=35570 RepID=UPI0027E3ACEB|nr:uncharacterized protein LOC106089810 isoform X3 [Stomoxys calcitrans]